MIILRTKQFSLISRGTRFIKELRHIDPLPITEDEYSLLVIPFKVEKNKPILLENDPELIRIKKKVNNYYGSPKASEILFRVGVSYIKSRLDNNWKNVAEFDPSKNKDIVHDSYVRIQKLPKRYIFDSLGQGAYGIVFNYSKNKVEKISFLGFTSKEKQFYEYLLKNPILVFPKIYTLEKDQVIMEKLDTNSQKCNEFRNYIKEYRLSKREQNMPSIYDVDWKRMDKELGKNHPFYKFVLDIKSGIKKIFGIDSLGDFGRSNIAERSETGEIVFFDPIGGIIEMEEK